MLKSIGEKGKISIRNVRREANDELKKKLKDKVITEDESKSFEKNIQKLTDTNIESIENFDWKRKRDFTNMNKLNHVALLWTVMEGGDKKEKKEEILVI